MAIVKLKKADVVVVGLGAVGGVGVLPFAKAGMKVVGLEAGPNLDPRAYPSDEILLSVRNHNGRKQNQEIPTWRRNTSQVATPARQFGSMMNAVGGTSLHYNSQSWRLDPWTFQQRSRVIARYGAGALPPGTTLEDMPFTYDDLEPYYEKVEWAIGVAGTAGNLNGVKNPEGNVLEAPRKKGYPMGPLRYSGYHGLLKPAAQRLGWSPFRAPSAVVTKLGFQNRPACSYCGFCSGIGCHSGAKSSTNVSTIPQALATKNLEVVPDARVYHINLGSDGRVSGVLYLKKGVQYFQPASVVFLATFAWENTRLLLLSRSKAFPNGLVNNFGQVGRHYFTHAGPTTNGLFTMTTNRVNGQGSQALHVDNWEADNFDHTGLGFIGGGSIDGRSEQKPIGFVRGGVPPTVPAFGSAWKAWVHANINKVGSIGSGGGTNSLPYEQFFMDLDPTYKDPLGFPVIRITYDYTDTENRMHTFLLDKQKQWLLEAGAIQTWSSLPVPNPVAVHSFGGTRAGNNPATSVADAWGMAHDVPNLGFMGASTMGAAGGHNPTLTAQALAWRTADHLIKNWNTIAA
jgi:gluconate 2-dehydrogenase alpha chain